MRKVGKGSMAFHHQARGDCLKRADCGRWPNGRNQAKQRAYKAATKGFVSVKSDGEVVEARGGVRMIAAPRS